MLKALFAAVIVVSLLCVGAQAANSCDELTGEISGSMVFENCRIPNGSSLTIGSDSNIKFFNLSAAEVNINVGPLNVIIHIFGGLLTEMEDNIFVVDTTSEVRNVALHAKDVTAFGTSSSAFSVRANNVQGVTIVLEDCDIDVGTSSGDRRGIGAILLSSPAFTIKDVTLTALRSVLKVRGRFAVAGMGVAVYGSASGHGIITSLLAHVVESDVQAVGRYSISSVGISVYGGGSVTVSPTNATMVSHGSNVMTSGGSHMASLGIIVYGWNGHATVSPINVEMTAHGSMVTTSGSSYVASLGIILCCRSSMCRSTLTAQDIFITAQLSHITATGPNAGVVVMGYGSFCRISDSIPTTTITNATVIACSSTIVSSEVVFDVVARFYQLGSPARFQEQRPVGVINWSVAILDSTITTEYAGWAGACLMVLPQATYNSMAPSVILNSMLSCSVPSAEMAPEMLFVSNTITRSNAAFAPPGAVHGVPTELPLPPEIAVGCLLPTTTPTESMTAEADKTPTATPTESMTAEADKTPTATPTESMTAEADKTPTATPTESMTAEADKTPTATPTKSMTNQLTMTSQPVSPLPIVALVSVLVLSGDFAALLGPNFEATLSAALQTDLADALGVESRLITITTMRVGSLIVDYTVTSTTSDATELTTRISALPSVGINAVIPHVAALYEAEHGTRDGLQIISSSVATSAPHTESPTSVNGRGSGMPTWGVVLLLFAVGVVFSVVAVAAHRVWTSRASKKPQQEDHSKNELTQAFVELNEYSIDTSKGINRDLI